MLVKSDPEGQEVTLTNQDIVNFRVKLENLTFDYAKGYFGSLSFSDTTMLNVEELLVVTQGNLNLDEIKLRLIVENGVKAMAQGEFTKVRSKNKQNEYVDLTHPEFNSSFNINPAQGTFDNLQVSSKSLVFDNENSTIQAFIGHLGHQYELGYKMVLNPWGNTTGGNDELFPQSRLKLRLQTDFPLQFSTENLVVRDTFEVNFSMNQNTVNVVSGNFELTVGNSFPFGSLFTLSFLDENQELIESVVASKEIPAAEKLANENKHETLEEIITFELSEKLAKELEGVKEIVVQADLSSAYSTQNSMYANAALRVKLTGKFKLKTSL
jgi:hypothetical protein